MEEESLEAIRGRNRNRFSLNRRKLKNKDFDLRRSLQNVQLTFLDVQTIANKLKNKASISALDLKLLQNALVDDWRNVNTVMYTHLAWRGLVRELTSHDINKQVASCGCLCNIALTEDPKICFIVAKAGGAYFVAALDTLTTQLAEMCAWTLGNVAGGGRRMCDVIAAQGAVTKLCDVIAPGNMREPVVYALTHFAYVMKDELRTEYLHKFVDALTSVDLTPDTGELLFILSCHKDFTPEIIPEQYLNKIINNFTMGIEYHVNNCKNLTHSDNRSKCCNVVFFIRVLANINNGVIYFRIMDYFVRNNLVVNIRKYLEVANDDSMLWLLGNMWNCCGDNVFFGQLVGEI